METAEIKALERKVLNGGSITKEEALNISDVEGSQIFNLFASSDIIRTRFKGRNIDLCCIVNARSGLCSEDCSFCAQSSKSTARIEVYPLLDRKTIIEKASKAKESGLKRFSIVTSGRKVSGKDLSKILNMISDIRSLGILPCASLGLLEKKDFYLLKDAGLERYHHNIESSENFFKHICSTHTYFDKLRTIEAAKTARLSICSGGLFGMGETWQDRIDMAFLLKELRVDSVPINFFVPISGTPLGMMKTLHPFEALKIISIYRFIMPEKDIRVCGGRIQILGEFHPLIFPAGADSLITGNYLTTSGRSPEDDIKLIEIYGLSVS